MAHVAKCEYFVHFKASNSRGFMANSYVFSLFGHLVSEIDTDRFCIIRKELVTSNLEKSFFYNTFFSVKALESLENGLLIIKKIIGALPINCVKILI